MKRQYRLAGLLILAGILVVCTPAVSADNPAPGEIASVPAGTRLYLSPGSFVKSRHDAPVQIATLPDNYWADKSWYLVYQYYYCLRWTPVVPLGTALREWRGIHWVETDCLQPPKIDHVPSPGPKVKEPDFIFDNEQPQLCRR